MKTDDVAGKLPPNHGDEPDPRLGVLFERLKPFTTILVSEVVKAAGGWVIELLTVVVTDTTCRHLFDGAGAFDLQTAMALQEKEGRTVLVPVADEASGALHFMLVPRPLARRVIGQACEHCGEGFDELCRRCDAHPGIAVTVHLCTAMGRMTGWLGSYAARGAS